MSKFEDTFLQMKPRYPEETIISNPPLIGSIRPIYQPPQKGQEKKNINQQLLLNRGEGSSKTSETLTVVNKTPDPFPYWKYKPSAEKEINITQYANIKPSIESQIEIDNDKYRTEILMKQNEIKELRKQHLKETDLLREQISSIQSQKNTSHQIKIGQLETELLSINKNYSDDKTELVRQLDKLKVQHDTLFKRQATLNKNFNESKIKLKECTTKLKTVEKELSDSLIELDTERKKSTEEINKRRINELEADIKTLKNTETQLNANLERLSNEHEKLKQKLEKIEGKKKRAEENIESQNKVLALANSELKTRATKIKELQQEKKVLQEAKDACKKEKVARISKLNTDKLVLEQQLAKITKEKEKADSEIKSLKSQTDFSDFLRKNNTKVNEERQERLERLREDQRQKEEQIKGLETDIKKIKSEYDSKIQSLSSDINIKEANILRLETELQESEKKLNTCKSSNEVLKSDNEKLIIVRNKLQGKLTECNQRYNKNRKTIQELQQQKKNIESRLSLQSSGEMALLDSKSILEDQIKQLESQITGLNREQERLKTLETQLQTCNSSNANLQREKEKLNNQLETCRKQRKTVENHLNERIKNLNTQIYELKSEKQYLEQSKSDFKVKSKDRIGYEQKQLQKLNEEIRLKDEEISNVKEELENLRKEYNEKERQLLSEIERKNSEISNLEGSLQASESSLKTEREESLKLLERIKAIDNQNGLLQEQKDVILKKCQGRKEKLNKELETCRKQRKTVENHLNERIKNLNTQIYELKSEKQYLEQSKSDFKVKSKDRIGYEQKQLQKLNEEIRLKDEEISNVKEELENLRKKYSEKERQLLSEIEGKNSRISNLEGKLQASEFILKTEREDSQRLLERIKELDLARKDAEEVNKSIENDRIELQRGITSKHVEIQRLERELDSLKRKLTELENNPAADFDAYNQGMEEAKQNYIQQIQELQSRISGFDTEKKRMEIQLEECTKVRLELSSKINDLEKLVGNLKLENEKLKLENENLVKQVKDREAGSVKLNEKLKVENQKLIKEREMYSSQFQQTQKLQADNTRYEEIVKSLQEKLQSEILKNRGEKSVIENEYRQSLETIEELNKQLETSKKLLSENSSKLLQTQQMQALQSFQSSQASQDKIKELENINNLLREEITKISEQLRLKNSEISREGSSRILEIKNEEERLTGILKRLNTEIGFSEHQLRQLQENISKKKDISVVSSFNLSINDEEYDRIQRIIRNVERVTKKCDKLSVSKMNK